MRARLPWMPWQIPSGQSNCNWQLTLPQPPMHPHRSAYSCHADPWPAVSVQSFCSTFAGCKCYLTRLHISYCYWQAGMAGQKALLAGCSAFDNFHAAMGTLDCHAIYSQTCPSNRVPLICHSSSSALILVMAWASIRHESQLSQHCNSAN